MRCSKMNVCVWFGFSFKISDEHERCWVALWRFYDRHWHSHRCFFGSYRFVSVCVCFVSLLDTTVPGTCYGWSPEYMKTLLVPHTSITFADHRFVLCHVLLLHMRGLLSQTHLLFLHVTWYPALWDTKTRNTRTKDAKQKIRRIPTNDTTPRRKTESSLWY